MIGTIPDDTAAERFSDYLVTQKIPNMVEQSAAGAAWDVWVENDDDIDRAKTELAGFLANASASKYDAQTEAKRVRQETEQSRKKARARYVDFRTQANAGPRVPPLTIILIVISMIISIGTNSINLGGKRKANLADHFHFTPEDPVRFYDWQLTNAPEADQPTAVILYWLSFMKTGQVWRLVTPIFLHVSILHLFFNLFWLRDLGMMIENRRGTWRLLGLVLACAIFSNFAEALWELPSLPNFEGMSGVVYGLFGYVWVKQRFEPHLGLGVADQTVWIMMGWLFACMTGMVGPVANAAHVVGLIAGANFAFAPIAYRRITKRMQN